MKRKLLALAASTLAVGLVVAPAGGSDTLEPSPSNEHLTKFDAALLGHTSLEPVVRGSRIMAGENLAFGETRTLAAASASPTPGVTQNGICNDQKPEAQVGETRTFWVHNFKLGMDVQKQFVLVAKTPHVYMWVDVAQRGTVVTDAQAQAAATSFERIYQIDRAYFGREAQCDELPHRQPPRLQEIWGTPWYDADDDRHINIVNFDPDVGATVVAGYYSSADEYPKTVNAHSNEGEFFYMNSLMFAPGETTYDSILAHEFYHMIQFANDANEETWVNEGMADIAIEVNYSAAENDSHTADYANHPDDQLTDWESQLYDYGNAYSFFSYFLEHYGPADDPSTPFKENYALAKQITQFETDGLDGIDDILAGNPYEGGLAASYRDKTADDVYLDRAVANVVNDRSLADGQYGYGTLAGFTVNPHGGHSSYPASEDGGATAVDPPKGRVYGDRIYTFESSADGTFRVDAPTEVPVVPNEAGMPSPTHFLWFNRGDEMTTYAVRAADLRGATTPRLKFSYWYDIEEDWDYAYVQVSTDAGASWTNLACCGARSTNPNGNNEGNGITGRSGAVLPTDGATWQHADVDLSGYAGRQVLVRFQYVTDPAVNRPGFTLDDVSLVDGSTAIWPLETFESGAGAFELGGNGAKHAIVTESNQPNRLTLQLVKIGRGVEVSRHVGVASGATVTALGPMDAFRTVAIFTSLTPLTSERFPYTWRAEASRYAQPAAPELTAQGGSSIRLSWTPAANAGTLAPVRYVVQEATSFADHVRDDAESGLGKWTTATGVGMTPWSTSTTKKRSGLFSFYTTPVPPDVGTGASLVLREPVTVPSGGRTTLEWWDWAINEPDDQTLVQVSENGVDWTTVYSAARAALPDEATLSLAEEPMTRRSVDLTAYAGKTIRLRFRLQQGGFEYFFYTPYGWYVDDVALVTEDWREIAETTGTSYTVTKAEAGTFFYRVAALYSATAIGPWSNVAQAEIRVQPDLTVSDIAFSSQKVRGGDRVTITATVRNVGSAPASGVVVRFEDDGTLLGEKTIPSVAAGGSATASVVWDTKHEDGVHTIRATADPANAIAEDDETNNSGTATVVVQGNKVRNASFDQSSNGTSPDNWTASGDTSYSAGSASAGPSGSWTSDAIDVQAGRRYELTVTSSGGPGTAVVEQLSAAGALLGAVSLPALGSLTEVVTVGDGVAQVRIRLVGGLTGTTFEHVGLYDA